MSGAVSVALCTYNGERFIGEQLASLSRQTRRPDEVVLCDDGSTDGTLPVAERVTRELGLSCRIHRNEHNLGFSKNFAQAIHRCTGEFIFFCDQDDFWLPEKIERHLQAFAGHPEASLVASDSAIVDESLVQSGETQLGLCHFGARYRRRLRSDSFRVFLSLRPIPGHAMSIRRRLAERLFPIPEQWPHDGWSCLLAAALGPVVVLNESLTLYRRHASQTIGALSASLPRMAVEMGVGQADAFAGELKMFRGVWKHFADGHDFIPRLEEKLQLIGAKIDFLEARSAMRRIPSRRLGLVWRECLNLRYFTFGQGWLSLARDVLGK